MFLLLEFDVHDSGPLSYSRTALNMPLNHKHSDILQANCVGVCVFKQSNYI